MKCFRLLQRAGLAVLMLVPLAACENASLGREGALNDSPGMQGFAFTLSDGGTGSPADGGIDTTPPDTRFDSFPDPVTRATTARFTFSSTETGGRFECKRSLTESFSTCTSPHEYPVTDGRHTFTVRAVDASGNVEPTPAEYSWTVDTHSPVVVVNTPITNGRNASFEFSANEPASFACRLDVEDFLPCGGPGADRGIKSYSNLTDGEHVFSLQATDSVGNTSALATQRWTVDTSPDTTLGSKPDPVVRTTSFTFTFSSTTLNASFECKTDLSREYGPCSSPVFYGPLPDGEHGFAVRAINLEGTRDSSPAMHTWRVDTTAPDTHLVPPPRSLTNERQARFQFSSPEADVVFECWCDDETFTECTSPKSCPHRTEDPPLAEGPHSFSVRAIDKAGNRDPTPAPFEWRVDLTPPQTLLNAASTRDTSARFSFSASEPASFKCSLDGASFAPCPNPVEYTSLAEGPHSFRVLAIDEAGNAGTATAPYSWTVDLSTPDTYLVSHPQAVTSSNRATFTFGSTKSGSTFRCSLNNIPIVPCQSPLSLPPSDAPPPLMDGEYTFLVSAIDSSNPERVREDPSPASFTWTVDTQAPDTFLDERPPELSPSNGARFVFSSEPGVTFECSLESAAYAPCESPRLYRDLGEGTHVFTVQAVDRARNRSAPVRYPWRVDTVAPDLQLTAFPGKWTSETQASFSFSSQASDVRSFECSLDGTETDARYEPCTSPYRTRVLSEGLHLFRVKVTDQAGNSRLTALYDWTVDTTPPTVRITKAEIPAPAPPGDPPPPVDPTSARFTFSVLGESGIRYECSLDSPAFTPCTSPHTYEGLPDTFHTFAVRAIDRAGNVGPEVKHTWTGSTADLKTTIDPRARPAPVTRLTTATFVFSANKLDATFRCNLDGEVINPCTSPFTRDGLRHGSHTFFVNAVRWPQEENTPASYTWDVDTVPPETAFSQCPAALTHETTPQIAFAPSEGGATFECNLDGKGFVACPPLSETLTDGSHNLDGRAVDKAGNIDPTPATCAFTVDTQPPETHLLARPPPELGSPFATFTFISEQGASFQCRLDEADFTPCTSPASYSGLQDGGHTFVVRAVDAAGNTDKNPEVASFTVLPAPLAPVVAHPASDAVLATGAPTFQGVAQKDTTVSVFVNDTLLGTTRADEAGRWSFQPRAALPEGLHTMSATATNASARTGPPSPPRSFTLDTTPPETAIDSGPPSERTAKTEATFTFSSTEPGSSFVCSLDDAEFTPCASPFTLDGVGAGSHRLRVAARDVAGNVDKSPAEHTWTRQVVLMGRGGGMSCGSTSQSGPTMLALLGLLGWALRSSRQHSRSNSRSF